MRNVMKASTIESKFPLLAVDGGCIISKDADITAAFRVELPELFTVTGAEYEAMHAAWCKAVKVLPEYSVVLKQDWFIRERYCPEVTNEAEAGASGSVRQEGRRSSQIGGEQASFLSRSYERHFNERPFLNHACFLYLTKTTKERARMQSDFSTLCRGNIIPKEVNPDTARAFLESVDQFERIINDSGLVTLTRLTDEEITGTPDSPGLIEKYFSLSLDDTTVLQDMELKAEGFRVGNKHVCLHTLSDTDDLPGRVSTESRYERLSTDRSDCLLSFAAPVGLLLSCDHIYNQWLFLDDSAENLRRFEKSARNMHSLARYSRSNQINKEWIDRYLNEAHSFGLTSIRAHFDVMAWSDDAEELRRIRNDAGSQLAKMECRPRHNTVDAATLYWAAMPGNAGDFPAEESFYTFIEPALCFFTGETNYRSSSSPFGIKMCDRISGKPLHLDISDEPMRRGWITNRNKFVLGPSGSGKSFFMNHLVRQYYEQGTHIVLVDTGNSYQGLCELIHNKTKGGDGIYFTYTEEHPISFNPFYTDDYVFETEKLDSIATLLLTLWKSADEKVSKTELTEIGNAVAGYIGRIRADRSIRPSFDTFYQYLKGGVPRRARKPRDRGAARGVRHPQPADHAAALLPGRALRLPAELAQRDRPALQTFHRLRDRRHQGQQGAVPDRDDRADGGLHQQDAATQRHPQDADYRGGMEGAGIQQYGFIRPIFVQDRPQALRRGGDGHAGGAGHHLVAHREGGDHQQQRLQNPARPAQIHEPLRRHPNPVGSYGQGEGADTFDQYVESSGPQVQGGLDRAGRRAERRLCHRGQ